MKRLAATAALALASGSLALLAISAAAGPAGAATPVEPVPWGGQGSEQQCLITNSEGAQSACLDLSVAGMRTTDGKDVLGRGAIKVDTAIGDSDKIARIQIDSTYLTKPGSALAHSATVNSAAHHISADTNRIAWWTKNCALRYRVQLNWSARLTDGTLKHGIVYGPEFDTAYAPCAGDNYGAWNGKTQCLVRDPDNSLGACLEVKTGLVISHDRRRVFARGSLALQQWVQNADQVARIQIDRTELKMLSSTSPVLQTSPTVNNNGHAPWAITAQTVNSQPWAQDAGKPYNCAVKYESIMFYSARLTNGKVVTGRLVSSPVKAPGC